MQLQGRMRLSGCHGYKCGHYVVQVRRGALCNGSQILSHLTCSNAGADDSCHHCLTRRHAVERSPHGCGRRAGVVRLRTCMADTRACENMNMTNVLL
jgi:hypothetical protein